MSTIEQNRVEVRNLMNQLKDHGVDKETAITISIRLRKPGQAAAMANWLAKNKATPEEICEMAQQASANKGMLRL